MYRESINITLDYRKGFFRKRNLNKHDIRYLKDYKYVEVFDKAVGKNKIESFFIKPNPNTSESLGHLFLVKALEFYLKKFTKDVKTYQTLKPDIIFDVNGRKYAIEVETGIRLLKNKKTFQEKVSNLYEKYGSKRWFFVLTSMEHLDKYQNYQKTYTKENVHRKIKELFRNCR